MVSTLLSQHIYDLTANIQKLVDQNYQLLSHIDQSLAWKELDEINLSNLKSDIWTVNKIINSLSDEVEYQISNIFMKYKLMGYELRRFTNSIKIVNNLSRLGNCLFDINNMLLELDQSNSDIPYEIENCILVLKKLIKQLILYFMKLYSKQPEKENQDFDKYLKEVIENINRIENEIDIIYSNHTITIIPLLKSGKINIDQTFKYTTIIRVFGRCGDISYQLIRSAIKIISNDPSDIQFINNFS